jgi:opacity protein-like surface antigen
MKTTSIGLLAIGVMAAAHAQAQQPAATRGHWYATAGAALVESADHAYEGFDIPQLVKASYETTTAGGTAADVGVGYAFANGYRAEAVASFQKLGGAVTVSNIVFFSPNPMPSDRLRRRFDGDRIEILSLDLNGYHDFPRWGPARPYLGAGLGLASVMIDSGVIFDDKHDDGVKLQVMGGATFDLSKAMSLYVEARWHTFTGLDFVALDLPSQDPSRIQPNLSGASLRGGLRVAF